jgi:hypothetical protein
MKCIHVPEPVKSNLKYAYKISTINFNIILPFRYLLILATFEQILLAKFCINFMFSSLVLH